MPRNIGSFIGFFQTGHAGCYTHCVYCSEISARCLIFKDAFNIAFAMQNPNHMENLFVHQIINSDRFKSNNRPRAQISQLRVTRKTARAHKRMLTQ